MALLYEAVDDQRKKEAARRHVEEIAEAPADEVASRLRVALERGWAPLLPPLLQEHLARKERDIDTLCKRYYNGYLDSVTQLVKLREDSHELQAKIAGLNGALQGGGSVVVAAASRRDELAKRRGAAASMARSLASGRELVGLAKRAASEIEGKRFVSAMFSLTAVEAHVSLLHHQHRTSPPPHHHHHHRRNSTRRHKEGGAPAGGGRSAQEEGLRSTPLAAALRLWLPGAQAKVMSETRRSVDQWLLHSRARARKVGCTLRGRLTALTLGSEGSALEELLDDLEKLEEEDDGGGKRSQLEKWFDDDLFEEGGGGFNDEEKVDGGGGGIVAEESRGGGARVASSSSPASSSPSPSPRSSVLAALLSAKVSASVLVGRTKHLSLVEEALGFGAWGGHNGAVEPTVRRLLAHASMPRTMFPRVVVRESQEGGAGGGGKSKEKELQKKEKGQEEKKEERRDEEEDKLTLNCSDGDEPATAAAAAAACLEKGGSSQPEVGTDEKEPTQEEEEKGQEEKGGGVGVVADDPSGPTEDFTSRGASQVLDSLVHSLQHTVCQSAHIHSARLHYKATKSQATTTATCDATVGTPRRHPAAATETTSQSPLGFDEHAPGGTLPTTTTSGVHATAGRPHDFANGDQHVEAARSVYESLRAPHFSPRSLLEQHVAQDPKHRTTTDTSHGGLAAKKEETPKGDGAFALEKWCSLVGAFPDLVDTLCGFFSMECTLLTHPALLGAGGGNLGGGGGGSENRQRTSSSGAAAAEVVGGGWGGKEAARRCVFSGRDLQELWLDACEEISELLTERFDAYDALAPSFAAASFSPDAPTQTQTSTPAAAAAAVEPLTKEADPAAADGIAFQAALAQDPSTGLLALKEAVAGLGAALGPLKFPRAPLLTCLRGLLPRFVAFQLRALRRRVAKIFATDANQPMVVPDAATLARWIEPFSLDSLGLEFGGGVGHFGDSGGGSSAMSAALAAAIDDPWGSSGGGGGGGSSFRHAVAGGSDSTKNSSKGVSQQRRFPVTFPFSASVPQCCHALHRFSVLLLDFAHGLGPDQDGDNDSGDDSDGDGQDRDGGYGGGASGGGGGAEGGGGGGTGAVVAGLEWGRGVLVRRACGEAMVLVNSLLADELLNDSTADKGAAGSAVLPTGGRPLPRDGDGGGNGAGGGSGDAVTERAAPASSSSFLSKFVSSSSSKKASAASSASAAATAAAEVTAAAAQLQLQQKQKQAVSISQAAQASLDARAFCRLMPRLGAVLDHALLTLQWPDAGGGYGGVGSDNRSGSSGSGGGGGTSAGVRLSSSSSFPPCASSPQPALSALNAAAKPVHTVRSACKLMEATADRAQDLIFELVRDKCDELLNIQGIEWEPLVAPEGPRPEVLDLVAYLRVTFMCLTYLPTTTREAVHFASLAHVHTSLRTELLDTHSAVTSLQEGGSGEASQHSVSHASRCTRVNALSLYALKLDVAALEAFADECGVPQLRACFRPLRQLLDALLDKRASTLLADEATRATLFPQLDAEDAIVVLEKVAGVAGNGSSAKRWGSSSSSSSSGGGGGGSGGAGGGGGAGKGGQEIPQLDKKQAGDLLKLLQLA